MRAYIVFVFFSFTCTIFAQNDTLTGCLFVDFENIEGVDLFEGVEISDQFEEAFGLTFSLEGGGFPVLAEVGGSSPIAFSSGFGSDTPSPVDADTIGSFFLTDDGLWNDAAAPPVILNFANAIDSFSGCILDMDGGEVFHIEVFGETGNLILEDSIVAGDPGTGDGLATCWGFNFGNCVGMVHQVKFSGTRPFGAFGMALDNFSFCYAGITEAIDYVICEGDSLTVNGEVFTEAGTYQQDLISDAGCDSLVFVVVEVVPNYIENESYEFCEGDEIEINGVTYDSTGVYQQLFQTVDGCDSIINLNISELPEFLVSDQFSFCEGDSVVINNVVYFEEGFYTQNLISSNGCDSIFQFQLDIFPTDFFTVVDSFCSGQEFEIVGEVFTEPGDYQVEFLNDQGCVGVIALNLSEIPSDEDSIFFQIIEGESIIVNQEEYNASGEYVQLLEAENGCDSILNILIEVLPPNPESLVVYDLNNCIAGNGYSEMTPAYPSSQDCAIIDASVFQRSNGNEHSCTNGVNGSDAMCISSEVSCDYDAESDLKIYFDLNITPNEGSAIVISDFSFFEKAPESFVWNSGGSGPNNYPTQFGIRIYRDGQEVYADQGLTTNLDWTQQTFNFLGNENFRFEENGLLRVELLAYCVVGNFSTVMAWDLDQVEVQGYCSVPFNQLTGRVQKADSNVDLEELSVILYSDKLELESITDNEGLFAFENLENDQYYIKGKKEDDILNGVSTLDLVLIQKHILNVLPFQNDLDYIAADINRSGTITALDLIELRKVLLGINDSFSNNSSWRFFEDQVIGDWQELPESVKIDLQESTMINLSAVKVGDVNNSYEPYINKTVVQRNENSFDIILQPFQQKSNQIQTVDFVLSESLAFEGLQIELDLGHLKFNEIKNGVLQLREDNFFVSNEKLRISYNGSEKIEKGQVLFSLYVNGSGGKIELSNQDFENEIYRLGETKIENLAINLVNDKENPSEKDLSLDFQIAPNPFKSETNIEFTLAFAQEIEFVMQDLKGKTLMTKNMYSQKGVNLLQLNSNKYLLRPGMYYLTMRSKNQSITKKIVVF